MKQAPPVKTKDEIKPGDYYFLSELPNGIRFLWKREKFETITHPTFNTSNQPYQKRPCFNIKCNRVERIKYGEKVMVIR